MWCLGTQFRGELDVAGLMVGLILEGLFQPKLFYGSVITAVFQNQAVLTKGSSAGGGAVTRTGLSSLLRRMEILPLLYAN